MIFQFGCPYSHACEVIFSVVMLVGSLVVMRVSCVLLLRTDYNSALMPVFMPLVGLTILTSIGSVIWGISSTCVLFLELCGVDFGHII